MAERTNGITEKCAFDAAARYFVRRGYRIIEKNWSCDDASIDIVAEDGSALVLVDVVYCDAAHNEAFANEELELAREGFDHAAIRFLQHHDYIDMPVRLDSLNVGRLGPDRAFIRHTTNVLDASKIERCVA
ncbi:YraN family protein [Adlercreutzia rubneri]